MKKQFDIIEEDGVVVYDESDDYDPGEYEDTNKDSDGGDGFRLLSNEEIFTDEYMQNYAKKMDDQIAKEKRTQHLISVGVIIGVVLFIAAVSYINFRKII